VPQVAPEAVETPTDKDIEPSPSRCLEQFIERRSPVLRARNTPVNEFRGDPSSTLAVIAKLLELIFDVLVKR
jgi:hypothetical protein